MRKKTTRPVDITWLSDIVNQVGPKPCIEVGVVLDAEDDGNHFDYDDEDLIVTVELVPSGRHLPCRVMAPAGGENMGVWSIPAAGAEVVVGIPGGHDGEGGVILGTLSTGSVPENLATTVIVVKAPTVKVIADTIELGASGLAANEGVVNGQAIDSFTGATQFALGNASSRVKAKKT